VKTDEEAYPEDTDGHVVVEFSMVSIVIAGEG
jgi:hypothetical protein